MAREQRGMAHVVALLLILLVAIVLLAAIANELDPTRSRGHAKRATPTASTVPPPAAIDTAAIGRQVAPAVVALEAQLPGGGRALGSGMVMTPNGETLTNDHVVARATSITARTADGHTYTARMVGDDTTRDIAVLQLDGVSNLPTVAFGDAGSVSVGAPVAVVDAAAGHDPATAGHAGTITAVGQYAVAGGGASLPNMIQFDAVMHPSGSGGPVTDARGRVIAVHTFVPQTASNTTFGIPIDDALAVVTQVDSGKGAGSVHVGPRAVLGLDVRASGGGSSGVVVDAVTPGGAAASAGIAAGDVLAAVDRVSVASAADVDAALGNHQPGDIVVVGWFDGRHVYRTASVRLGG